MKISFPNCDSGAGISIRAVINALLKWHMAERAQTAHRKKSVPQITPEWNYRPREAIRRYAAVESARAETSDVLNSEPFTINNNVWCTKEDSYINA
jgi:Tfp pilus assembly protein PilN